MRIKREHYDQIIRLASNSRHEVCGMLSRHPDGSPADLYAWSNISVNPMHTYEAAPRELMAAFSDVSEKGNELAAIYHSHPSSLPVPSQMDVQKAFYPDAIYLIAGQIGQITFDYTRSRVTRWTITGWSIGRGRFEEVPLEIED